MGSCNSRKSPGKHDISRRCLKCYIDSLLITIHKRGSFPSSCNSHIIPGTSCPTHSINISIGIKCYKSQLIASWSRCYLYLQWSTSRRYIYIRRPCPARTIPDIIIRISTIIGHDDDSITRSLFVFDIESSVQRSSIWIIDRIPNSRQRSGTSP